MSHMPLRMPPPLSKVDDEIEIGRTGGTGRHQSRTALAQGQAVHYMLGRESFRGDISRAASTGVNCKTFGGNVHSGINVRLN